LPSTASVPEADMKDQYVADLREGMHVDACFALGSKELRSTRTGEAFLAMEIADRTGRIPAILFKPDAQSEATAVGDAVRVRGTVTSYRGRRRVSVESLRHEQALPAEDLLPATRRDKDELLGFLAALMDEVHEVHLRRIVYAVFGDATLLERFAACPASRSRHHATVGGLLEHTVDVATLAQQIGQQYPYVDADLLLAGALLHDVGKVDELACGACVSYTDAGRLVGHVVLGERMVSDVIARLGDVPRMLALRLSHLMISHHGELEWGSPRRPATLEALILHHVDNLDAKMAGFMQAVDRTAPAEGRWTDAVNMFKRPLYAPRPATGDRTDVPDEDAEYCMEHG
jgi:3'-5' exoribonuclease